MADTFLFLRSIIFWFIFSGQLEHDHGTICCVSFRDLVLCCQWATSRYGLFNYQMMGKHMAHWDLNPFKTDGIFHKATYNKIRTVHCIYRGKGFRLKIPKNIVITERLLMGRKESNQTSKNPLKIDLVFANSADPDEMPQKEAFYLGLHCLLSIRLEVYSQQRVNIAITLLTCMRSYLMSQYANFVVRIPRLLYVYR